MLVYVYTGNKEREPRRNSICPERVVKVPYLNKGFYLLRPGASARSDGKTALFSGEMERTGWNNKHVCCWFCDTRDWGMKNAG